MRLYSVTYTAYIVVQAEDETEAKEVADAVLNTSHDYPKRFESAVPVISSAHMPPGWDNRCLPFKADDDKPEIEIGEFFTGKEVK